MAEPVALETEPISDLDDLAPAGESILAHVVANEAVLVVTEHRLIVNNGRKTTLDVGLHEIRRIQLDIERDRAATFILVPDRAATMPEVLTVGRDSYHALAEVLIYIAEHLDAE